MRAGLASDAIVSCIGLGVLAACLAGTVLLEVSGAMPDSRAVTAVRASNTPPPPARPAAPDAERASAWAATALARPLFNPDRRPPATAAQAGPAAAAAETLPRMTGVLVTSSVRRAIFAGPDGTSLVVQEGGRVGPYTVVSVRAGQAVVSGPDGEHTVRPAFDPNAKPPAATAAPPAPPGLPGLPGFRLNGGAIGGVPGLTGPDLAPGAPGPQGR